MLEIVIKFITPGVDHEHGFPNPLATGVSFPQKWKNQPENQDHNEENQRDQEKRISVVSHKPAYRF